MDILLKRDGKAIRAFCHISEAVEAFFKVLLSGEPRKVYNVGKPKGVLSIVELAKSLVSITLNRGLKVRFTERLVGVNYLISPINKSIPMISAMLKLNWSPSLTPRDGFAQTLKYFGVF